MPPYHRRHVLKQGILGAGLIGGLHRFMGSANASMVITDFSAPDQSILTRDGTVSQVTINPKLEFAWEGVRAGTAVEIDLRGKLGSNESYVTVDSKTTTLENTTGTKNFEFSEQDILEMDAFSSDSLMVDEPGSKTVADLDFQVTSELLQDEEVIGDHTVSAMATLTVERLPEPTITSFSVEDDSNPQHTRCTVDWAVSDEVTELESVTSALIFSSDSDPVATETSSISGSTASGEHEFDINETDPDGYVIELLATNSEGITREETIEAGDEFEDPGETWLTDLFATITESESHGNQERPTAATIEFAAEFSVDITATMAVNETVTSESQSAESGTFELELDPGGGPTDTATIEVVVDGGSTHERDITVADGTVDMLN